MFMQLEDLSGKSASESIKIMENYLRATIEELNYILSHLDSSNVIEIDIKKTRIYEGE